jgi:hypothetical protein
MTKSTTWMKLSIAAALILHAVLVWGQTAVELEGLLQAEAVTYTQAAYFILASAPGEEPVTPDTAFALAVEQGWLPEDVEPDAPITLGEASFLMMRAFDLSGGMMYSFIQRPRYAARELSYRGYIQGRSDPYGGLSGTRFLQILGRVVESFEEMDIEMPSSTLLKDFGLIVRQTPRLTGVQGKDPNFSYNAALIPWLSLPLGSNVYLYLSGGFSMDYSHSSQEWSPRPEVYQFALNVTPVPALHIQAGRIPFWDSSSVIAAGLFDGASARFNIGGGNLNVGLFYTGLLYKNAAYVAMTVNDKEMYYEDTYFASRRLVMGAAWEAFGFLNSPLGFSASILGQFDLNFTGSPLHSQYLDAALSVPLGMAGISARIGGVVELIEEAGNPPVPAFAASTELLWLLPTVTEDSLSLGGRISSGTGYKNVRAFLPITGQAQGRLLRPAFTGVAIIEGQYTIRPHRAFSAELNAAYLFRTDKTSFFDNEINTRSNSYLLGGEVNGGITWMPLSDIMVSLSGGVFFPHEGTAFKNGAGLRYSLSAGITLSF